MTQHCPYCDMTRGQHYLRTLVRLGVTMFTFTWFIIFMVLWMTIG